MSKIQIEQKTLIKMLYLITAFEDITADEEEQQLIQEVKEELETKFNRMLAREKYTQMLQNKK